VRALPTASVLSEADPGLALQSLLAGHNRLIRRIGAGYTENAALHPARVHRDQTVSRALRLHGVAADDVRTTAGVGHRVVPLLAETITEVEVAEEVPIVVHRLDAVGTVVDMGGGLSRHRHVGGRRHNPFLHPAPEPPG